MHKKEDFALDSVYASIQSLPGVSHQRTDVSSDVWRILLEDRDGVSHSLGLCVKEKLFPKDVLGLTRLKASSQLTPLVVSDVISASAKKALQEQEIAYWESGGSLYLPLGRSFYFVDKPRAPAATRAVTSVYQGKTAQVLQALLLDSKRLWNIQQAAEAAGASAFTVHQVFEFLEQQLWMEKLGRGPKTQRRLTEPGELLNSWSAVHRLEDYRVTALYCLKPDLESLLSATASLLEETRVDYAFTLDVGAHLVAPFLTREPEQVHVLCPEPLTLPLARHKFEAVKEGGNVCLLHPAKSQPERFRRRVGDYWVASDVQLYLDLASSPRRGAQQAKHLRERLLAF